MSAEKDEFRGVGGSFTKSPGGVRKRVEETVDHPEGNRPRDKDGRVLIAGAVAAEATATEAPVKPAVDPAGKAQATTGKGS